MRLVTRGASSCLLLACCLRAWSATYVVGQHDAAANDDGPGTPERPWRTVARAARAMAPGDRVLIRDGVYRERVVLATSGTEVLPIAFEPAPGAPVVLTGADQLKEWQRVAGDRPIFEAPWPHHFIAWSGHMTHPDDQYHRLIGRCEQVAIDDYLLRQVLETKLKFEHNVYFAAPGQGWFNWGVTWGQHVNYPSLAEFAAALHVDIDSSVKDPGFSDILANDYRLDAQAAQPLRHSYPGGSVPEVTLGLKR